MLVAKAARRLNYARVRGMRKGGETARAALSPVDLATPDLVVLAPLKSGGQSAVSEAFGISGTPPRKECGYFGIASAAARNAEGKVVVKAGAEMTPLLRNSWERPFSVS